MARRRAERLDYLHGTAPDGSTEIVSVSKIGRDSSIGYKQEEHLCHPSVRSIETCKRQALIIVRVHIDRFEPV